MRNSQERLTKSIPVMFKPDENGKIFPDGYRNDVAWWGNISREKLHSCLPDGTAKMLCMDLDIGNVCGLNCPHCFRRDERVDSVENPLIHEQVVDYVKEAHEKLGLEQVKVAGRGEPFQNPRFLEFLEEVVGMGVGVSIFTKGHVFGNDLLAKRYNGHRGIYTARQLVARLKELKVSILLGFNSFNKGIQEAFTGVNKFRATHLLKDYVQFRDQALVNLVNAGFNDYIEGQATRLAMVAAPIKPENIDEIFELYTWARRRNIYMLSCPTTVSGKGEDEWTRTRGFADYPSRLEDLWAQIYAWAIKTNLITLETFKRDGVSLYPGCHPCNQTAAGMYLNLSGQVIQCPGRVVVFSDDIRKDGLKSVWLNSPASRRAKNGKAFNYHCLARDGHSLHRNFYQNVEAKVLGELGAK